MIYLFFPIQLINPPLFFFSRSRSSSATRFAVSSLFAFDFTELLAAAAFFFASAPASASVKNQFSYGSTFFFAEGLSEEPVPGQDFCPDQSRRVRTVLFAPSDYKVKRRVHLAACVALAFKRDRLLGRVVSADAAGSSRSRRTFSVILTSSSSPFQL